MVCVFDVGDIVDYELCNFLSPLNIFIYLYPPPQEKTTILTPPLFIEVPVPGPEIKHSCICVLEVSILVFSTNFFLLDFGTVQTVCYFLFSILFHI